MPIPSLKYLSEYAPRINDSPERRLPLLAIAAGLVSCAIASTSFCQASGPTEQEFTPPSNVLAVGFRETATHRPPVMSVAANSEQGMPKSVDLWIHVDSHGRVLEVRSIEGQDHLLEKLRDAAQELHYAPFMHNAEPVEAWVQDSLTLTSTSRKPRREIRFPQVTDASKVSIRLCRSGCYGSCPSYTVAIRGNGEVTYRGERNVSFPGTYTARISRSSVSDLLDKFRSGDFWSLENSYRAGVTDSPTYIISLSVGGKTKLVEDYVGEWVGMPAVVTELEDEVDRFSDSARWVRSSRGTLAAMEASGVSITSLQAIQILRTAANIGDLDTVRKLIAAGTPVDMPVSSKLRAGVGVAGYPKTSLLEIAVESQNASARAEVVEELLSSASVRIDRDGMQAALARAVESGYVDVAKILIDAGADPNARLVGEYADQERDETYLMLAAASGVWAMLDDALARPHDIRAVDAQGRTALVNMAYNAPPKEDIFPLLDRLLAAGADRSELDRVLLDTCHPAWITGLVARGGNVNARDAKGNTPLFQSCSIEGVEALLAAGANPNLRNNEGKTAIQTTYPPEDGKEDSRAVVIRGFMAREASAKSK